MICYSCSYLPTHTFVPSAAVPHRLSFVGVYFRVRRPPIRTAATDATSFSYKVHVRLSVVVAEASLSEAGRPRLRAWEHSHAGPAHGAAVKIERLGVLAFCDPSEV